MKSISDLNTGHDQAQTLWLTCYWKSKLCICFVDQQHCSFKLTLQYNVFTMISKQYFDIKFHSNMWYFQIKFDMVCTSKKLFPSVGKKWKYVQKLFVYSPLHPRAFHPEKEKNNYWMFCWITSGQTQNVIAGSRFLIRTNNALISNLYRYTDWTLGCKILGCCEDLWKAGESNNIVDND